MSNELPPPQQQQQQQHPLTNVNFISLVVKFACRFFKQSANLALVSQPFEEVMTTYADGVWQCVFEMSKKLDQIAVAEFNREQTREEKQEEASRYTRGLDSWRRNLQREQTIVGKLALSCVRMRRSDAKLKNEMKKDDDAAFSTPLQTTSILGHTELLLPHLFYGLLRGGAQSALLCAKGSVDPRTGETPLMVACRLGDIDTVRILLADVVKSRSSSSNNNRHNNNLNKTINDEDAVNFKPIAVMGETMFTIDSYECGINVTDYVSEKRVVDQTPLTVACLAGHEDIVKFLVNECDAKLDKSSLDQGGDTALMVCARDPGKLAIAKFLVSKGASVSVENSNKQRVLCCAAMHGNVPMCQFLCELESAAGIKVSLLAMDRYSRTALAEACERGKVEVVRYLLTVPEILNHWQTFKEPDTSYRCSPLACASNNGSKEISQLLIEAKKKQASSSLSAAAAGGVESCELSSVLCSAAAKGHLEQVKFYLSQQANVNARSKQSMWTPLMWAVWWHHHQVAQVLLDAGADKSLKSDKGETALDLAYRMKDEKMILMLGGEPRGEKKCAVC